MLTGQPTDRCRRMPRRTGAGERLESTVVTLTRRADRLVGIRSGGSDRSIDTPVDLGPAADWINAFRALRTRLDLQAQGFHHGPGEIDGIRRMLSARLAALRLPTDGAVTVVPPPDLMTTPWSVLSPFSELPTVIGLPGRPIDGNPAPVWSPIRSTIGIHTTHKPIRATSGIHTPHEPIRALLVAGPGLEHGRAEIRSCAAGYRRHRFLHGAEATMAAVERELAAADIAHIVGHGRWVRERGTTIELADGPWTPAGRPPVSAGLNPDTDRRRTKPTCVILSACRPWSTPNGDGERGMGSLIRALLSTGATAVVSAVGLIPDNDETVEYMKHLHRNLLRGHPVAEALVEARRDLGDGGRDTARFQVYGSDTALDTLNHSDTATIASSCRIKIRTGPASGSVGRYNPSTRRPATTSPSPRWKSTVTLPATSPTMSRVGVAPARSSTAVSEAA